MTSTKTVQSLAEEAYEAFEGAKRTDGTRYYKLASDSPGWMTDMCREAHAGMFPDDWKYQTIMNALERISEADDPEDERGEFADSAVNIYNGERIAWLASHGDRADYCNQAAYNFGSEDTATDIIGMIGQGQYSEADEVYGLVLQFLEGIVS